MAPASWSRNIRSLFEGIRYAIGEAGGFTFHVGGRKLYPIMVAEKQICWLKATVRGRAGHGSMPVHGEAMARLARACCKRWIGAACRSTSRPWRGR